MPLKVFTQRLFQKRMQSSKIFEEFEVLEDKDFPLPRGEHHWSSGTLNSYYVYASYPCLMVQSCFMLEENVKLQCVFSVTCKYVHGIMISCCRSLTLSQGTSFSWGSKAKQKRKGWCLHALWINKTTYVHNVFMYICSFMCLILCIH